MEILKEVLLFAYYTISGFSIIFTVFCLYVIKKMTKASINFQESLKKILDGSSQIISNTNIDNKKVH